MYKSSKTKVTYHDISILGDVEDARTALAHAAKKVYRLNSSGVYFLGDEKTMRIYASDMTSSYNIYKDTNHLPKY